MEEVNKKYDAFSYYITDAHPCNSNPCQNGGTCTEQSLSFICTCRQGFAGRLCETGRFASNNKLVFCMFMKGKR